MPATLEERKKMMEDADATSPRANETYFQSERAKGLPDESEENPVIQDSPFKGGKK